MRIVVMRQPLAQTLKWGRRLLFVCAGLTLGYCGYVLADARIFQYAESRSLERQLQDVSRSPNSSPGLLAVAAGGMIGRLEIPRLGLSVIVIEGEDNDDSPPRCRPYPRHGLTRSSRQRWDLRASRYILPAAARYPAQ